MSRPSHPESFQARFLESVGLSRALLFGVGGGLLILALLAALLPTRFFGSIVRFVGLLLLGSAALKSSQFLFRRLSPAQERRSFLFIAAQVVLDAGLGLLLLNHREFSVGALALLFGLLFLGEGLIIAGMALKAPVVRTRLLLAATAAVIGGVGVAVLLHRVDPVRWAGALVGLKLFLFGLTLVSIAAFSPRRGAPLIYQSIITPEVAELYSVYFGAAFHLGVYIGDGEVVHYLDDNHVHRVTWDQFLEGRCPNHQVYPDLPRVPPEQVVEVALSEVGKEYPYNLLRFNCEHFAIFCKSGGTTHFSKFAQIPISLRNVAVHPFVGLVAELNTRIVEYLAFHLGGPSGRKLSLQIRRIGSTVTAWLLTRGARATKTEGVREQR
jgi:hypothetical protein